MSTACRPLGAKTQRRRSVWITLLFWSILLLPLAALLVLLAPVAARVVELNQLQPDDLARTLEEHLRGLRSDRPPSRTVEGTTSILGERAYIPLNPRNEARHLIYVFGASSVVIPTPELAFARWLEKRLNGDDEGAFRVANLGRSGATSGSMLATVRDALAVRAPDLMILYEGHNDYTYAYRAGVLAAYGFIEGSPRLDALARRILVPLFDLDENRYWAMRTEVLDPRIGRWLQRLRLVRIDPALVNHIDTAAQRYFEANFEAMIAEAQSRGIPVLLITPVSNLEFEPFGIGPEASEEYRLGMRSASYAERIAHLQRARDLDVFNGSKRAKAGPGNYMRGRKGPGVHVLDLEQRLIEREFSFGWGPFVDAMHMDAETHVLIADYIHSYLVEEDVCCGLGTRHP